MNQEPQKAITLRAIEVGGHPVSEDSYVWVLALLQDQAEVEINDRRGLVPLDALAPFPVAGPSLAELRRLDACFGLPDEAFEVQHADQDRMFEVLRCLAHGRIFLRDVQGSIALWTRLTLIESQDEGCLEDIWERHHRRSDSWLILKGRTLVF